MLMHKPTGFDVVRATSLEEAVRLLVDLGPGARPLAGGTDLMVQAKFQTHSPHTFVSLSGVRGADFIRYQPGQGLFVGALTTLRAVDRHPAVREHFAALHQGAHVVGSLQIRNQATLAGNLCNAAPSADCAGPLLVLGSRVRTLGPRGQREIPLDQFWTGPGSTVLDHGELVSEVVIPDDGLRSAFLRFTPRGAMDIAVVNVAAALAVDGGTCRQARIALGAVAPTPILVPAAAAHLEAADRITPGLAAEAARIAASAARPISDVRASADYRRKLVAVLVRRTLAQLTGAEVQA